MGNNIKDNNSSSDGVCQKLFTAFKVSLPFQTIRRISYRPRGPTPAADHGRTVEIKTKSASTDPHQQKTVQTADHVQTVPIKLVSTDTASQNSKNLVAEKASSGQNDVVSLHDKRKLPEAEVSSHRKKKPELASTDHDPINATFTEYIKRTGSKIRTIPESDGGDHHQNKSTATDHSGVMKKKGSFKDHFEDYIHRTKVKIASPARSTPSVSTKTK